MVTTQDEQVNSSGHPGERRWWAALSQPGENFGNIARVGDDRQPCTDQRGDERAESLFGEQLSTALRAGRDEAGRQGGSSLAAGGQRSLRDSGVQPPSRDQRERGNRRRRRISKGVTQPSFKRDGPQDSTLVSRPHLGGTAGWLGHGGNLCQTD